MKQLELPFDDIEIGDTIIYKNGNEAKVVMFNDVLCAARQRCKTSTVHIPISIVKAFHTYKLIKKNTQTHDTQLY